MGSGLRRSWFRLHQVYQRAFVAISGFLVGDFPLSFSIICERSQWLVSSPQASTSKGSGLKTHICQVTRGTGPESWLHEDNLLSEQFVLMRPGPELLAETTPLLNVAFPKAVNALGVLVCDRDLFFARERHFLKPDDLGTSHWGKGSLQGKRRGGGMFLFLLFLGRKDKKKGKIRTTTKN